MRRSRIKVVPFAAGLLVGLIATIWYVTTPRPQSQVVAPEAAPACAPSSAQVQPAALETARPPAVAELLFEDDSGLPPVWIDGHFETPGFPDERVRLRSVDSIPPDELYPQNRVILRKVRIDASAEGMQISGQVLTDFVCDRGPQWLPSGPLLGMKLNVELYHYDTIIDRSPKDNEPRPPHIDPRRPGTFVAGQSTDVATSELRGEFAVGHFALPRLGKPLPPGFYRLVATLSFRTQNEKLLKAVKWCSSLYGARPEYDEDTMEVNFKPVMKNPELHEEVYRHLTETMGALTDEARIEVGQLLNGRTVELVGPDRAGGKRPANILIRDYHHSVAGQVAEYEHQLDNVEEVVNNELAWKLRALNQKRRLLKEDEERKQKWKEQAEEDKKRIRRDNGALIERYGGRVTEAEAQTLERVRTAQAQVLEQIATFQDRLALQCWIMSDGIMQYAGRLSIYRPGYDVSDAIKNGRLPPRTPPAADPDKWLVRTEKWKYVPHELRDVAFQYLRAEEESDLWHPANFTAKSKSGLRLDRAKWAAMRDEWIVSFTAVAAAGFRTVDTTRQYAVQLWSEAKRQLELMWYEIMFLPWSWEYYIRTVQQGEAEAEVVADWTDAPVTVREMLVTRATVTPGKVLTRYDAARSKFREAMGYSSFISRYSKAIMGGEKPPGRE